MKNSPQKKKTSATRKPRCRALIPLDTQKIIAEKMKVYNRRKKTLNRLQSQLAVIAEKDEPEYQKFLAGKFGAEQTRQREIQSEFSINRTRYEQICFMASVNDMKPDCFCYFLSQRITEEHDFWYLLQEKIEECRREELEREEEERIYREKIRNEQGDDATEEWPFEDDPEEMEEETDDSDDSPYKKLLEEFYEEYGEYLDSMLGISEKPEDASDAQKELKKLYRELCLKYHPDKIGQHDARLKRIWNEIQSAYEKGDTERLRSIYFDSELNAEKKDLSGSEIDGLISDIVRRIAELRDEMYYEKKQPFYGFSGLSRKEKKELEEKIRKKMAARIYEAEQQLAILKNEIEKLLHGWQPKTKTVKKNQKEYPDETAEQPDLFSF